VAASPSKLIAMFEGEKNIRKYAREEITKSSSAPDPSLRAINANI
jgi:hypothetical protein